MLSDFDLFLFFRWPWMLTWSIEGGFFLPLRAYALLLWTTIFALKFVPTVAWHVPLRAYFTMVYTQVVVINEIFNFVVGTLSVWDHLMAQIFVSITRFLWFLKWTQNIHMVCTNVIALNTIYNFVVDIFIWDHLEAWISILISHILIFKFFMFLKLT